MTSGTTAFMFAGQGAQYVGMGQDLLDNSQEANRLIREADSVLGENLSEIFLKGPESTLTETQNCQLAVYTVSLACLAALQERMSITPCATAGLSLGEFAAVQAAGGFSFADGVKLVKQRSRLMQKACEETDGSMAAVKNADWETLEEICRKHEIEVANHNSPGQKVITGPSANIREAVNALKEAGVKKVIELDVAGAFHSQLMASAADEFAGVLENYQFSPLQCPVAQNVVGKCVSDPQEVRQNLGSQITGSVFWEDCVNQLITQGAEILIELGPGKVLSGLAKRINRDIPVYKVACMADVEQVMQDLNS